MAEETTTVDLVAMSNKVKENLKFAREDFEGKLEAVQEVVENIDWELPRTDTLVPEIGTITFNNYESVVDLLDQIVFTPLDQRALVDINQDKSTKHVFISPSLDAAEQACILAANAGGTGSMKFNSGVFLDNAMREALRAGQERADNRDRNDYIALLDRYASSDHVGNRAWLDQQHEYKRKDRDRNVYTTLFSMAQDNVDWAYKKGIQIEALHESFTARYNRLFLDITQANITAYKAEVQGNIAELEGQLKNVDAQMTVEKLKFKVESTEWQLKVDQANSRMQAYVSEYQGKMNRNLKMISTRMIGGQNIAEGYKSIYSAYSSLYSGVSLSNSGE
jgi:hypothetical protein